MKKRKLKFRLETIRVLRDTTLRNAAGGITGDWCGGPETLQGSCWACTPTYDKC